jgi:Tfp pilus assembly protein PilN
MIKVNLLKDQTARVRKTFGDTTASRMGLIYLAIFVLAAGGMGTWYIYLHKQIAAKTEKRNELRVEEARLQELQKEIEKFEEMKRLRQSKIDVIETLKENQTGPVLLLNHLIHSMPRSGNIWLKTLDQKADQIKVIGYAQRDELIPDFMVNLESTGFFKSVDLETIESENEAFRFSLICMSKSFQQAE